MNISTLKFLATAVILVVLAGCNANTSETESVDDLKKQAAFQDSLGNYQNSISLYGRILDLDTGRINQIINLTSRGKAKLFSGDSTGAMADLDQALAIIPMYKTAMLRGLADLSRNKKDALKFFYLAKSLEPDNSQVYYPLLHFYTLIDLNNDSSLFYANYLLGKTSTYEKGLYMMLMNAFLNNSVYDKIILTSDSIIRYETDNAFAYNNRGYAKMKLGQYADAKKDIYQSLKVNSKNSYAYRNLGLLYLKINNKDSACISLDLAQKLGFLQNFGREVDDLISKNCP